MAASAAAAIASAIKASGVLITVDPENFQAILSKAEKPLVICTTGGIFSKNFQYLTRYKGFAFFTKSRSPLDLSLRVEVVQANRIWVP
ncbi:MAG TPA: hypothetical protein VFU37_15235 [Pyrinomonadaceae bacterium]|nr:hypothetical protein [Pyrinomonadaceae bacterium]